MMKVPDLAEIAVGGKAFYKEGTCPFGRKVLASASHYKPDR
jgi:hypothetical protein